MVILFTCRRVGHRCGGNDVLWGERKNEHKNGKRGVREFLAENRSANNIEKVFYEIAFSN